ncbi:MAG: efflux RND transporter periplasmic adaptor subunit [Succinatimonas hippei]|nr:efflux RND transporter periplasmic adaptor subunit [Succinatimonas hippei]
MKRNGMLLTLATVSIAVTLVVSGCGKQQQQASQALPVDVYTVNTMTVPVTSRLSGRANPVKKAEVRPQVNGVILKRLFVEGSEVHQGDQLYQIDPAVYQAQLASAEASLASARATLHSSQLKAERYANLLGNKAVSKQDYDDAQATFLANRAAVQAAEAALKTAQINLAYTKVYAPISGTIDRSTVTEGALVSAQQASALTTITQLDPIYVDMGQTVEDHLALRRAMKDGKLDLEGGKPMVDIYFTNGEKYKYRGTLEFAEVSVDETTGMVNLRALVPNPDHVLLPSMYLRGEVSEGVSPNNEVVYAKAVQREATGQTYVYVINDKGIAERRNIKVGQMYKEYYTVTDGLAVGDKVIASNFQKLREGTPVQGIPMKDDDASNQNQTQSATIDQKKE